MYFLFPKREDEGVKEICLCSKNSEGGGGEQGRSSVGDLGGVFSAPEHNRRREEIR